MTDGDHVRFLQRIRRRWCAWCMLECAAAGAGAAALTGTLLVPLLWWGGFDTFDVAGGLLLVGALTGAVAGLLRRPSLLQTAMEVDRQFDLHDLFSTAISSPAFVDADLSSLVVRQAADVCRTRSGGELLLRKLGGRAWGGVSLASALLLTLALLTSQPASSLALGDAPDRASASKGSMETPPPASLRAVEPMERAGLPNRDSQSQSSADSADPAGDGERGGSSKAGRTALADSGGTESGKTSSAHVPLMQQSASNAATGAGSIASGGGLSDRARQDGSSVGSVSTGTSTHSIPPWQSPTWHADREAARRELDAGHISDAYRDLVREYFDRDTDR